MPQQRSKIPPVEQSPVRAFARAAVTVAQNDVATGVLLERIADYLCVQLRALHGKPTASLHTVPLGERNQMLQFAVGIVGLVRTIDGELPPTDAEVLRYHQNRRLTLARGRVRCQASANGHALSVWRPDPDRSAHELAACERCRAGASIHVATGHESISDALLQPCPRRVTFTLHDSSSSTGVQTHG
jgi:hypothetical protein